MVFDVVGGADRHMVDIDDEELLENVLDDILTELRERGKVLKGDRGGEPQVVCNGKVLDTGMTLPEQEVFPNEVLKVSVRPIVG
jgi:hypothetical protein